MDAELLVEAGLFEPNLPLHEGVSGVSIENKLKSESANISTEGGQNPPAARGREPAAEAGGGVDAGCGSRC